MSKAEAQALPKGMAIRSFESGDEFKILDLLNLCYGAWGDLDRWRALYANYPNFTKEDVFIIDNQGEVIGHRGLHFRQVDIGQRHRVPTVSLGDTAVHPHSRGLGLYATLHEVTLDRAESRGASLAITWNLKGSTTYDHNRKTGFVELRQTPAYMRIVNPGRVLRSGLSDFIHKNQKLRGALQALGNELYFSLAEAEFSVAELVGETSQQPEASRKPVKLVFTGRSLSFLTSFRTMSRLRRVRELTLLLLCRRVKVRFGSLAVSLRVARKVMGLLGYI